MSIHNEVKLVILRGIPGSGKSHYAQEIREDLAAAVLSADDYPGLYTEEDGKVAFHPELLGEAHGRCLRQAVYCLQNRNSAIIDNTNLSTEECAPYVALGLAYGASVEIHNVEAPVDVAFKRQTHGVPRDTHWSMYDRFVSFDPPYHWKKAVEFRQGKCRV